MSPKAGRPQLDALTSLRFFAALHVVLYHSQAMLRPSLAGFPRLLDFLTTGPNSVGFFFVLSGFILAYTYLGPPEEGRLRLRPFWAARFARVYPVYFLGLLFAAPFALPVLLHAGLGRTLVTGTAAVALVQAWVPQLALGWNSPGWSLSAEAFFYLVFPFVAPSLWPQGRRWVLLTLIVFWGLAQVGPALFVVASDEGWLGAGPLTIAKAFVAYSPLTRLPEFLFGVALGRLFLFDAASGGRSAAWSLGAFAAGSVLLTALAHGPAVLRHVHVLFFNNGLLTPLYGLVIYGLARARDGALARVLSARPLVVLGEASYALYLLHLPLRDMTYQAAATLFGERELSWPAFAAFLTAALVLSLAVLRGVEEPARRFLRQRLA